MIPSSELTGIDYRSLPFHPALDNSAVPVETFRVDLEQSHTRVSPLPAIGWGTPKDNR
jgi:hypothetical protein